MVNLLLKSRSPSRIIEFIGKDLASLLDNSMKEIFGVKIFFREDLNQYFEYFNIYYR